jgi:DNA polymerase I
LKEEADAIKALIIDCMQTAMPLTHGVPVIAEAGTGTNWLEAH